MTLSNLELVLLISAKSEAVRPVWIQVAYKVRLGMPLDVPPLDSRRGVLLLVYTAD